MQRNFDRRVEAIVPVKDPAMVPRLHALLATYMLDNRQAWDLNPDGSYTQRNPDENEPERASHTLLMQEPWGAPVEDVAACEALWSEALQREPSVVPVPATQIRKAWKRARARTS
jgi:hypothetical protein